MYYACLRMFVCLAQVANWLVSSCLSKPVESFEFTSHGPLTCLYPVWQTDMHNDLPGETNDWDSWLGQSAVTKASDKSCVNKLFWNVMVGITRSKIIQCFFILKILKILIFVVHAVVSVLYVVKFWHVLAHFVRVGSLSLWRDAVLTFISQRNPSQPSRRFCALDGSRCGGSF